MRQKQPRGWDSGLTFLLIGCILILACLLIGPKVMGADWRPGPYRFPAVLDTAYTCFYEDDVLDDSSAGRADVNNYDTIFTYTPGSYIKCIVYYKYHEDDEWGAWSEEYYSASLTGTGPYSATFLTWDSTTDLAVPAHLTIRPVDQSTHAANITTGADGHGTANLTIDSFVVLENNAGWTQDNDLDTIVVAGANDTFTIYMDQYAVDAPAGGDFCAVVGYLTEIRDLATVKIKNVKVCFTPTAAVRNSCNDTWPVGGKVCTFTNDEGIFTDDLLYSSCMVDEDGEEVEYEVTIEGIDIGDVFITVPDADIYYITWE